MLQDIQCEKRTYHSDYESHQHTYFQMIMSLDGKLDLQLKQGQIEIKKDHLYLLEDTCEHGFRASENNTFLILDIPTHLFSKMRKSI